MKSFDQRPVFWVAYVLFAIVCLAVAWRVFPEAMPIVHLDVTMTRQQAVDEARALASKLALAPADARTAIVFNEDGATQSYVELEGGGKDAFAKLVAGKVYAPYWWEVRLFKPGEVDEATVRFRPDGTVYGFTAKRPDVVEKLVIVDIGPEISARAAAAPPGPPEPETWQSIEQAAQHLYRGNPYPGIHYYRWVAASSLRQSADGALVWKWHPSVKERRTQLDIDWWAMLRTIAPPTLVLRGESSTVLDRDVAERMAKELPRGRFVEIPRAVHTLHEDNPDAVLAALKGFLEF